MVNSGRCDAEGSIRVEVGKTLLRFRRGSCFRTYEKLFLRLELPVLCPLALPRYRNAAATVLPPTESMGDPDHQSNCGHPRWHVTKQAPSRTFSRDLFYHHVTK